MKPALLILVALAGQLSASSAVAQAPAGAAEQDLVVTLGPVSLAAHAEHHAIMQPGFRTFSAPSAGWVRAYVVELRDGAGRRLPNALLHHCEMVDLERRQLLEPGLQRVVSVGSETPAMLLPTSLGYPVRGGHSLGIHAMLANPTDRDYPEVYVRVILRLARAGAGASPRSVLTFHAEVPGDHPFSSSFSVPAGRTVKETVFTIPIAGTLMGVGGHLHDYGRRLLVINVVSGDTLYDGRSETTPEGRVLDMPQAPLWARGGVRVAAGTRFRLIGIYDNPTARESADGGMVTFGAIFMPDDGRDWPVLDWDRSEVGADLARLMSGHSGMMMGSAAHAGHEGHGNH